MPNPCIPCPTCGFTMKPVWYLEKNWTIIVFRLAVPTRLTVACSVIRADTKKPSMTRLMSFPNNMR
jgi:hypothetical protein